MENTKNTTDRSTSRRRLLARGALLGGAAAGTTFVGGSAAADSGRYARGLATLREVAGEHGLEVIRSLQDIAPDLGRYIVEFAFGDIYSRPGLEPRQRQLVTIGALTAQGDTAPQLDFHVDAALRVGVTPVEVIETLFQIIPFMGFARAFNAVTVARQVFERRGIRFEPPVLADERDRHERGAEKLVEIDGEHGLDVIDSLRDIAPDLGRYIIEFTFGDIYYRPWLSAQERQLVTIGALTAFGDTTPQLRVHIGAALNVGLTRSQVIETLIQVVSYAGFPRVLNALGAAREVFEHR